MFRRQLLRQIEAAHSGNRDLRDQDIGQVLANRVQGGRAVAHLRHHLDVRFKRKQHGKCAQHKRLSVRDDHADHEPAALWNIDASAGSER